MKGQKRKPTTIYLDPRIAQAMKMKAAITGKCLSDQVNDALIFKLKQDEEDLRIVRERRREPGRSLEEVLRDMKKDGLL